MASMEGSMPSRYEVLEPYYKIFSDAGIRVHDLTPTNPCSMCGVTMYRDASSHPHMGLQMSALNSPPTNAVCSEHGLFHWVARDTWIPEEVYQRLLREEEAKPLPILPGEQFPRPRNKAVCAVCGQPSDNRNPACHRQARTMPQHEYRLMLVCVAWARRKNEVIQ